MNQSGNIGHENASLQRSTTPQMKRECHLVKPDQNAAVSKTQVVYSNTV